MTRLARKPLLLGILLAAATPGAALAWGAMGHRLIGQLAMAALPADLPAFLTAPEAAASVGELAREPDRWKDAGRTHDSDRDSAHFLDLGDDGKVFGGPSLADLPPTRAAYEAALRAVGADGWRAGYLPYSIVDGWQQVVKDFTLWRIEAAAARTVADPAHRAWFQTDLAWRETLTLRDIGALAHYVGDGSQPLHVSVHFNGWGDFPNPEGFTESHIHAPIEGAFVHAYADTAAIRADMTPYGDCRCTIWAWTVAYLEKTEAQVAPLYRLEKAGAFADGDARGRAFVEARLAAGASALRDIVVDAWRASADGRAGWPAIGAAEVVSGKLDPYDSLYGVD